jgi:LmbE family N-acetylglucosaminyl deacetylase
VKRSRRAVTISLAIPALLLLAAGAWVASGGRGPHASVRPADVKAAKATGDALLASTGKTFLVFIAHPDDAEWWAGGTLAMLAKHNAVVVVLGTSGDAGNGGLQRDLGQLRERLQREGAAILGYTDVVFLGHPDGHLAEAAEYPGEVADIVRSYRPDGIFTFDVEKEGPVYQHADHEAAGRAALAAARNLGGTSLYLMHTGAPDVIVDFAPAKGRKAEALSVLWSYHDSGVLGFVSRFTRWTGLERRAEDSISRSPYPEVGVEYGEVFREEIVAPGPAPDGGA